MIGLEKKICQRLAREFSATGTIDAVVMARTPLSEIQLNSQSHNVGLAGHAEAIELADSLQLSPKPRQRGRVRREPRRQHFQHSDGVGFHANTQNVVRETDGPPSATGAPTNGLQQTQSASRRTHSAFSNSIVSLPSA